MLCKYNFVIVIQSDPLIFPFYVHLVIHREVVDKQRVVILCGLYVVFAVPSLRPLLMNGVDSSFWQID